MDFVVIIKQKEETLQIIRNIEKINIKLDDNVIVVVKNIKDKINKDIINKIIKNKEKVDVFICLKENKEEQYIISNVVPKFNDDDNSINMVIEKSTIEGGVKIK